MFSADPRKFTIQRMEENLLEFGRTTASRLGVLGLAGASDGGVRLCNLVPQVGKGKVGRH